MRGHEGNKGNAVSTLKETYSPQHQSSQLRKSIIEKGTYHNGQVKEHKGETSHTKFHSKKGNAT